MLRIEPRLLYMLSKHITAELKPLYFWPKFGSCSSHWPDENIFSWWTRTLPMVMQVEEDSSKGDSVNNCVDIIAEIAFVHCGRQSRIGSIKSWAPTSS